MAAKAKRSSAASRGLAAVGAVMQGHADRGVFRRYESRALRGGRVEHRFLWLAERPFAMIHDPARGTLTFAGLLPGIEPRSDLDRRLREFVKARADRALPEHRRIDPRRAKASCVNRAGSLSVVVKFGAPNADYAARKAIALVNEIFFSLLGRERRDYMAAHFNLPEE